MSEPFETDGRGRKRNSCKAIIVMEGRLLLTVNRDRQGDFYLLPGGGQRFGETLTEALCREVLEETGWVIEPGRLILARDYIGANHEFAEWEGDVHQTELVFLARPVHRKDVQRVPDPWQTGIEWVSPEALGRIRIYPSILAGILPAVMSGEYEGPAYLGDVN
ncbi:MAG: NUDIX domain-containing protein [Candidatus Fermentibacteraceae bacterium]|nr:NUDIX domain-containing protein [Candidatus Fermentibacteraceae bacterium]MBN2608101.1 NUDIX domain-containing protein [Candidatus Fermentibacteraceae bacterium]